MKKIIAAASSLAIASIAFAETPDEIVVTATNQAVSTMSDGALSAAEAEQILAHVDVDAIARFALGQYVRDITDEEFGSYRTAFAGYLVSQMQKHLERLQDGDVAIDGTLERGSDQAIVETEVTTRDGERMDVNWRLRDEDGTWRIIDIEAMDLWLAIEQRAQFTSELDKSGGDFAALTKKLKG